jgi:pantoate--beta-alanine ligase/3-methyl-2-oxobutanoate hydroxymethyltransferase
MCALVAVIRRCPGGAYAKTAKSGFMPAVPVDTSFKNYGTFVNAWPEGRAKFLLYGTNRSISSFAKECESHGKTMLTTKTNQGSQHHGDTSGGNDVHLYGLAPTHGASSAKGKEGEASASGGGGAGAASSKPLGLAGIMRRFNRGRKLSMLTAYDFPSARFARAANVELVLVGDSIGNCRLGLPDTVGVTMEDISRATLAVRRGVDAAVYEVEGIQIGPKPVIVGDMPFGSYLLEADALKNAASLRISGADMVKLEGGKPVAPLIRSLTNAGIAVMGHVGLEPQSALLQGGLKMQGTTASAAFKIIEDAQALADAGAVAIVLECVPAEVGHAVQLAVPAVPVIGIGAGGKVAGQVLVSDDILAMHGKPPSFAKQYADIGQVIAQACAEFVEEVQAGTFPDVSHQRQMKDVELSKLSELLVQVGIKSPFTASECDRNQSGIAQKLASSAIKQNGIPSYLLSTSTPNLSHAAAGDLFSKKFALAQARAVSKSASCFGHTSDTVEVLRTRNEVTKWRAEMTGKIALVPTMGNLHEGHLELVQEAKRHADVVLVSIFVNPAQFAAHEDLDSYPRTLDRDLALLRKHGVSAAFTPGPNEMYPSGSPGGTVVVPTFVQGKSEDASRPHFFTGVATVCLKLFNLCRADVVVFGQKDAMQCAVIARMLEDLMLSSHISLVVAPTSREVDGLARSSRNSYLTPGMRAKAPAIFEALTTAAKVPTATPGSVRGSVQAKLEKDGMEVQYVSVADPHEMNEKADDESLSDSIVSIACMLRDGDQECRLIDNIMVPP